ncbi:hypothetical protein J6590_101097 [Homalodisca vitripennis]|nr:hypothetical protein J6590_101097 [Homalodisca vitripennis]
MDDSGRDRSVRDVESEELALDRFEADPSASTAVVDRDLGGSKNTASRVLQAEKLYLHRHEKAQSLKPEGFQKRLKNRCASMVLEKDLKIPMYLEQVLFKDGNSFTAEGIFINRTCHI